MSSPSGGGSGGGSGNCSLKSSLKQHHHDRSSLGAGFDQQQQQVTICLKTGESSLRMSGCSDERAESESGRSDKKSEMEKGFATPELIEVDRSRGPTPAPSGGDEDIDDRMSVSSRLSTRSTKITPLHHKSGDQFEKDVSYNAAGASPAHSESKLNLAMVPVISDQLLHDIVNKERSIEQADVHLFVKKCLDLLAAKNTFELKNEQLRQKVTELEAENRSIRESKVRMQLRVEQEEEYISNMLLKRIQKLKSDKEQLAQKYEQEEEHLTNDLLKKLSQLEGERDELSKKLGQEQSWVVGNLLAKIRKLEAEIQTNQKSLDQLRREKVDLENSLEHEQEALFNTLGKRMDSLEAEKRRLQQQNEHVYAHNQQLVDRLSELGVVYEPFSSSVGVGASSAVVVVAAASTTTSTTPATTLAMAATSSSAKTKIQNIKKTKTNKNE